MAAAHAYSTGVMVVICSMMWSAQERPHCPCIVTEASVITGKEAVGRWATQESKGHRLQSSSLIQHWVVPYRAS